MIRQVIFFALYLLMPVYVMAAAVILLLFMTGESMRSLADGNVSLLQTAFACLVVMGIVYFLAGKCRRELSWNLKLAVFVIWAGVAGLITIGVFVFGAPVSWKIVLFCYAYAGVVLIDLFKAEDIPPERPHVGTIHLD